jgi:hypothetical protein
MSFLAKSIGAGCFSILPLARNRKDVEFATKYVYGGLFFTGLIIFFFYYLSLILLAFHHF